MKEKYKGYKQEKKNILKNRQISITMKLDVLSKLH